MPGDGRYLDPTDAAGQLSPYPGPGPLWPLEVDMSLAYANEPPASGGYSGTNATVQDGADGKPLELLFVTTCDVQMGEEILIDYGSSYDRSGYCMRRSD